MRLAVVGCRQIATLAGPARPRIGPELDDLAILEDGAFVVEDGIIVSVGSRDEVEPLIRPDDEVVDAVGRLVLPGFVDAHTHLPFVSHRAGEMDLRAAGASYLDIASRGGGIQSTVRSTNAASYAELLESTARHASWMVRSGTTTAEAKSGYGLSEPGEVRLLEAVRDLDGDPLSLVGTFLGTHATPPGMDRSRYLDLMIESVMPEVVRRLTAEYCDIFVENGYFSADDARRVAGKARALGLGLRMHVDQLSDGGGAALAAELGAKTADHLEQTGLEGIRALAEAGVQPVLLPASVYGLGLDRYPSARAMVEKGLALVVATDFNPGSSPCPSMPFALSLARTHMKLSAAEAITAGTINAAYSLDRGHDRGSLEPGKRADFTIWDAEDYREIGYWVGMQMPDRVYIAGRQVISPALS